MSRTIKHPLIHGAWMGLLALIMLGVSPASAQDNNQYDNWSNWISLEEGTESFIKYRTVTHPDSSYESGYRTEYEVLNQHVFSISFTVRITFAAQNESFDEERKWHLGPNSSGVASVDAQAIQSMIITQIAYHTTDHLPH